MPCYPVFLRPLLLSAAIWLAGPLSGAESAAPDPSDPWAMAPEAAYEAGYAAMQRHQADPEAEANPLRWWQAAAAAGHVQATMRLAEAHAVGQGTAADIDAAVTLFAQAAAAAEAGGPEHLAVLRQAGELLLAVDQPQLPAWVWSAQALVPTLQDGPAAAQAQRFFAEAAAAGDSVARIRLLSAVEDVAVPSALRHSDGSFAAAVAAANDLIASDETFRQAAARFSHHSLANVLADPSRYGEEALSHQHVSSDAERRILEMLLSAAAEGGHAPAMVRLGDLYAFATTDQWQDPLLAVAWYERAAMKGLVTAMQRLGYLYTAGVAPELPRDPLLGRQWYGVAVAHEAKLIAHGQQPVHLLLPGVERRALDLPKTIAASDDEGRYWQGERVWLAAERVRWGLPCAESHAFLGHAHGHGLETTRDEAQALRHLLHEQRLRSAQARIPLLKRPEIIGLRVTATANDALHNSLQERIAELDRLRQGAALGSRQAAYRLHEAYHNGQGVARDAAAAERWCLAAAAERRFPATREEATLMGYPEMGNLQEYERRDRQASAVARYVLGRAAHEAGDYARAWELLRQSDTADARLRMGLMYTLGQGVIPNDLQAVVYLERVHRLGSREMASTPWLSLPRDLMTAFFGKPSVGQQDRLSTPSAMALRAEREGSAAAMYALACWHLAEDDSIWQSRLSISKNDQNARPDRALGLQWLQRAVAANYPPALWQYGMMLLHGRGVAADPAQGRQYLEQAARAGEPRAALVVGQMIEQEQPGPEGLYEAYTWYEAAWRPQLQYRSNWTDHPFGGRFGPLGGVHLRASRILNALARYRHNSRLAEGGDVPAMISLGNQYTWGDGVEANADKAQIWRNRAFAAAQAGAEKGDILHIMLLAQCYRRGIGTTISRVEEERWLEKAATAGHLPAMLTLGRRGQRTWLEQAAAQDSFIAVMLLADGRNPRNEWSRRMIEARRANLRSLLQSEGLSIRTPTAVAALLAINDPETKEWVARQEAIAAERRRREEEFARQEAFRREMNRGSVAATFARMRADMRADSAARLRTAAAQYRDTQRRWDWQRTVGNAAYNRTRQYQGW